MITRPTSILQSWAPGTSLAAQCFSVWRVRGFKTIAGSSEMSLLALGQEIGTAQVYFVQVRVVRRALGARCV